MDLGLRGKTAIVAAASQGLGKAVACALANEGANVVMFSRREDAIQAAAQDVRQVAVDGATVTPLTADVTRAEDLERVVAQSGGADVLFANAGGPRPGYFDDLTDQDFYAAFDLNLMSAVRLVRLCLPHMRQKQWGRIIISTSYSVKQPIENLMLSNSIRSGVTAWAKTLADQVGKDN